MEALVVVLGLVVVPALVAAVVVALVVAWRKPAVPEVPIEELLRESAEARALERDAAVKTAIDHLVRMNEQMLRPSAASAPRARRQEVADRPGARRACPASSTSSPRWSPTSRRSGASTSASSAASCRRPAARPRCSRRPRSRCARRCRAPPRAASGASAWPKTCCASPASSTASTTAATNRCRAPGGIPDYTFLLPQGLSLHMDVKFPLNNYLRFLDATSDVERDRVPQGVPARTCACG